MEERDSKHKLMNTYHCTMQAYRLISLLCCCRFPQAVMRGSINGNKLIKTVHKNVNGKSCFITSRTGEREKSERLTLARVHKFHSFFVKRYNGTSEKVHTIRDNRCRASHTLSCVHFATLFFNDFRLCAIRWNINGKQKRAAELAFDWISSSDRSRGEN